jgi:hypothetical protein
MSLRETFTPTFWSCHKSPQSVNSLKTRSCYGQTDNSIFSLRKPFSCYVIFILLQAKIGLNTLNFLYISEELTDKYHLRKSILACTLCGIAYFYVTRKWFYLFGNVHIIRNTLAICYEVLWNYGNLDSFLLSRRRGREVLV